MCREFDADEVVGRCCGRSCLWRSRSVGLKGRGMVWSSSD